MKRCGRCLLVCLLVSFVVCLLTTKASAQVLYGSLVGTITDQSDAAVPKAEVIATNIATNKTYRDVTDDQGRFSISDVLSGTYSIKASASGFSTLVQNNVNVSINTVSRLD